MKTFPIFYVFVLLSFCGLSKSYSQCELLNEVQADGSMMYYFEPATFYYTKSKSLKINLLTDDENFYIVLQPTPFPEKSIGKKINDDLKIQLSNKEWYVLKHYDTQYLKSNTIFQVVYLINKRDLDAFTNYEAETASISMKGTRFVHNYAFKLHKRAIMEQIACYHEKHDKKKPN